MAEALMGGAVAVMQDPTWNFAIEYIDKDKEASTSEAVSNGIWNEILRRNFPYPKFIIAPEQRQTTGIRPDFTIFFVDQKEREWHPVFTFEGKAPYHIVKESIIEKGIEQAAGYVPSLSWSNNGQAKNKRKITYGMFACGKSFVILQYNVDNKKISPIDPQSGLESAKVTEASLNDCAQNFDAICKSIADSFK
ncbi:hypothetical protein FBULB1_13083 [Fusarium bulbicola]|nr:hypothetical protein FBULB1_13083 [Fusarium bulbicola]